MYISRDNVNADEYDFAKALELLSFVADQTRAQMLRMRIWCAAILRNQWEDLNTDDPVSIMPDLLFFRIAELYFSKGLNLAEFLPPLDELLEMPELQDLGNNPSFSFMLGAGYEHMQRVAAC
ncbi:hypothetical protein HPB50_022564 [Hyalomma asiaticum]|uniref:Uncharacterized protein n=2 Tax=Hyalomma TaxID=34625 RepID=A0ACB7RZK3_HYAAI|nr:hypothetical protein HPB50_022564 [Hyalomma asiaticum]